MLAVTVYTILSISGILVLVYKGVTESFGVIEDDNEYPVFSVVLASTILALLYWWLSTAVVDSSWLPVVIALGAFSMAMNLTTALTVGKVYTLPFLGLLISPLSILAIIDFWSYV